ncbi:hypothetical protein [Micromonospora tulbaghiae]|uniref:hypothetical protein n=1 Tax=Micromonospora tulbaghiae TaxID=479978 RepID=UPI003EB7A664
MDTLSACPADCPLAAYATGRPVRIDLDNLARPTNRRLPRRCQRCHRLFIPGKRGPVSVYCNKRCLDAAKISERRRAAAVPARMTPRPPAATVDVLDVLGINSEDAEVTPAGYVDSTGRELRELAQTLRTLPVWTPQREDYTDTPEGEAAYLADTALARAEAEVERAFIAMLERDARSADLG